MCFKHVLGHRTCWMSPHIASRDCAAGERESKTQDARPGRDVFFQMPCPSKNTYWQSFTVSSHVKKCLRSLVQYCRADPEVSVWRWGAENWSLGSQFPFLLVYTAGPYLLSSLAVKQGDWDKFYTVRYRWKWCYLLPHLALTNQVCPYNTNPQNGKQRILSPQGIVDPQNGNILDHWATSEERPQEGHLTNIIHDEAVPQVENKSLYCLAIGFCSWLWLSLKLGATITITTWHGLNGQTASNKEWHIGNWENGPLCCVIVK